MCFNRAANLSMIQQGCLKFDGGNSDVWDRKTSTEQAAWCRSKGWGDGAYSYMDEAECRKTCHLMTTSPGATSTCTTPP